MSTREGVVIPSLKQQERDQLDPFIHTLSCVMGGLRTGSMAGYLHYVIVRLLLDSLLNDSSYLQAATAIGVLENVKRELQDRLDVSDEDTRVRPL